MGNQEETPDSDEDDDNVVGIGGKEEREGTPPKAVSMGEEDSLFLPERQSFRQ